jgi:hypothetical protein
MNGRGRVEALVAGAKLLADGSTELGQRTRRLLLESTGLSAENIAWALTHALETAPTPAELHALVESVVRAPAAFVILPANVFVAAHRAVALALAASPVVRVRASRREPHFARLLREAAPELFELVEHVAPEPDDHVFAYGADQTLGAVRAGLAPGVTLHAHGSGFGVALLDAAAATPEAARALAVDISAFDQRGCLSPRTAFVLGSVAEARRFGELVAVALTERARTVPLGRLDDGERADAARFRDLAAYAGTLLAAGPGSVCVCAGPQEPLAPVGRNLTVVPARSIEAALSRVNPALITAAGVAGSSELVSTLGHLLPNARLSELGRMQRPAFDGPADRRAKIAP